ncbi:MAG: hypothetical protein IT494_05240 [Gammaproteobacteria bacterium]|nr:hypothetical protein [Gammaproteobacteria bacterium]
MAGVLTLFVPGLAADRDSADDAALPTLRSLLARARHATPPVRDPWLRQRQLLDPSASISGSLAELMREGDAVNAPARHWLRADPVCLQPDRATLRLLTAASFALDVAEADALIALLNAELGGPGWQLYRGRSARRWYLGLDAPANATAPAPDAVARGDYDRSLPAGTDAMRQRRWLNDAQMVLHAAPGNAARERRGALPINSFWLWGGAASPAVPDHATATPQLVFADDPLSRALATRLGRPWLPLPDAATLRAELRARRGAPALLLVVPDSELAQSPLAYLASLAATLRALVREGVCNRVLIETERELWTLTRFDALCFWRRQQPVFAHG